MSCKQFALKNVPYKVVGNREWNCVHFAEEGMPFSQSAVSQTKWSEDRIPTRLHKYACYVNINLYEHIHLHTKISYPKCSN